MQSFLREFCFTFRLGQENEKEKEQDKWNQGFVCFACGGVRVLFVGRVAVLEVCLLGVFRVLGFQLLELSLAAALQSLVKLQQKTYCRISILNV